MCGIVGILNFNSNGISKKTLKKMTDSLIHRGPDEEGYYIDNNIGLGHRRLSIIDLSPAGNQPMLSQDGNFAIVYNGEVYNFQELRKELKDLGYKFNSQTDSEVVLYSYIQWGSKSVNKFNGMFSFAIWNKLKKELFISRDRYGIKPLYYSFKGGKFLFASEQKAILLYPEINRNIDLEALLEYFTFQNIFTDKTLFQNIHIFPPGCWATIKLNQNINKLITIKYWDYNFKDPNKPLKKEEYIEELDRLFYKAVQRQLVSDVEIGTYLSGGMDSGSITAIAAKQFPYIKSFTCGFDLHSVSGLELAFDEREKAELMSHLFKTEHYEMVLKAGDMERIMPKLIWHLEEPRIGQSYPNFYISQLAGKFVKVALSGGGGDELFGGYPWRYFRAANSTDFEDYIDKYYLYWQRLIPNKFIKEIFKPVWGKVKHVWTRDIFKSIFTNHWKTPDKPEDYINYSLYFEAKTFLHGLLVVEDKLSMAHSLETRLPFLDNDLVDFAMQIPLSLKLRNLDEVIRINENESAQKSKKYYVKTNDGKLILRNVMKKYIPNEIINAEKQGFSAPDATWFRGESIDYIKKLLFNKNANIYEFFDRGSVQQIINKHLEGKQNLRLFIWSLLNFEWWCRIFLKSNKWQIY